MPPVVVSGFERRTGPVIVMALTNKQERGVACWYCWGSRAVPDDLAKEGYGPCRSCVIDAGMTFVVLDEGLGSLD